MYLSLSSHIHPVSTHTHTHIHTHTHTHTRTRRHTQTHTAHIDFKHTAEGIPFIKDLQAALCLFVCVCDCGLTARRSSLSRLIHSTKVKILFSCTSLFGTILKKQEPEPSTFDSGGSQQESSAGRLSQAGASFIRERERERY